MMRGKSTDILKENKIIDNLYKDGIVKAPNLFDQNFLKDVILAKNRIFSKFPYGQNNNFEKILNINEANKIGYYPIKNPTILEPILMKILKNKFINHIAEEILGKDYICTNFSMRIVPKTNKILETHRDFCGGLSFSLLLDNIEVDQGETFFFKDSYKNPPPTYVNLNNFSANIVRTTGKIGDVYFWFADSWHGKNYNLTEKNTCILMVDLKNKNSEKNLYKLNNNDFSKITLVLNNMLRNFGNAPDSLIKHLIYCLLRFKFFKNKIDEEKLINSRLIKNNYFSQNFSIIRYFKMINYMKLVEKTFLKIGKFTTLKKKK